MSTYLTPRQRKLQISPDGAVDNVKGSAYLTPRQRKMAQVKTAPLGNVADFRRLDNESERKYETQGEDLRPFENPDRIKMQVEKTKDMPYLPKSTKTPYNPVKNVAGVDIGMNIIQPYKEDSTLKQIGKGAVNYGLGTVNRIFSAPQQALMQATINTQNAIQGKPLDFREKNFSKDIIGMDKPNVGSELVGAVLDPATWIGGGIVDDLSRAGMMGKASRPSTEMVRVLGESQQKILSKMRAKLPLTQVEIETVNSTPELRALPEAKQYLMLPEGKITTPDVIEALPVKPTTEDISLIKTKPQTQDVLPQKKNEVFYTQNGIEVIKNPTDKQHIQLREEFAKEFPELARQGEPRTRRTYDIEGNEYIWKSTDGMHREVENYIDKNFNTLTHQSQNFDLKYDDDVIKNFSQGKGSKYKDYSLGDLKRLKTELEVEREQLLDNQINWLKSTSGKGVQQGNLFRDEFGNVVGRQGRISNNEKWYQDWAKANNYRKITNSELRDIAEKQLREGYESVNGSVPPDYMFNGFDDYLKEVDSQLLSPERYNEALNKSKQYLNAKGNIEHTVPEQYRKETPFTVSRSTVPPTVQGKFTKEEFNPLGGDLPKAEPKPIGGELPKQSGIPIGEKPLSFPQTVAKSYLASDELKQMIKDNPLSHKPINNPDTLKYAQQIVDQNFEAAKRVVKEGETFQNATESAMAQDIIRRLQNDKQWDEAFEVMEATARKAKTSGQTIQAFSMWRRMTPEGMLRYAGKVFKETGTKMTKEFADKLTESMKRIEGITDENQLRNAIMRQAGEMPEWAYKSMSGKTADQLKDIAMAQVLSDISEQVPKSVWKKVSTVQAMSHLINVKTAARNVLGNLSFGAAEKVSNAIAVPFDAIGSIFTKRRTLTIPKVKGTFKAGFGKAKEAAFDASLGIDRAGVSAGKYNVPIGGSFKGKLGKAGEKALKYELNVPDEFFKGQVYEDVLKQQMGAAKVTEPTQEMIEYATKRAEYSTFQDDSLPARILQGVKDILNNIGGGARRVGKSGIKTREFGLGDFLIKYTTVPGNLISRSVEYTPAGLLKIISIANDANLSGAMKQSEIAMAIGRAITGTSMIAMGVALHRAGLLLSEDKRRGDNAKSLDQAEGLGNYKVNVSAVERILDGGDVKPQDGDMLQSYNWIEPLSVQIAIGAAIDSEMQRGGSMPEIAFNAGNDAMEEILDLPTLSVIRQMTYQDNAFDVVITPLVQGVSGFVPSPVRQYAQYQDPVSRLTKSDSTIGGATNRLKSALPSIGGLEGRKGLEPKIDPFGRETNYPSGMFNALINPGQTSTYKPSEITPQLKQLEDITGETDFYPRDSAPFSFTYKKQTVVLTPQEKTIYMRIEGEEVLRRYKEILASGVEESNAEARRNVLIKAKYKASDMARSEILKQRGLK